MGSMQGAGRWEDEAEQDEVENVEKDVEDEVEQDDVEDEVEFWVNL